MYTYICAEAFFFFGGGGGGGGRLYIYIYLPPPAAGVPQRHWLKIGNQERKPFGRYYSALNWMLSIKNHKHQNLRTFHMYIF